MLTRSNKDIFVRGFAKALEEKWQVDVQLKGRDSDEGVSIFAHKLVLASRSEVLKKILELDEFKAPSQPVEAARPSQQKGRRGVGVGPILSLIPLDNALHDAAFSYIIKNLKTIVNSLEFKLFANRNTDLTVEIIRAFMARRNIYY
ncbi:BnaCnng27060D [Brassica napus]|uniref:BTB domain-containing protein n=2 Tax=Brassica TaxID=3705 RepID=A0A3P6D0H9_BRAOL|nr:unnamed protein product [Brassica napus]CDY54485.1 BnaCnng27060D [Brassica napus]VDD14192.1 unnamed protein product [Brassica oleracea]